MLFCFEPLKLHLIRFHLKWNSSSILSVCWTHTHTHTSDGNHSDFTWQSPPYELASISKEQVILKEVQTPCWCRLNSSFDSHSIYKTRLIVFQEAGESCPTRSQKTLSNQQDLDLFCWMRFCSYCYLYVFRAASRLVFDVWCVSGEIRR